MMFGGKRKKKTINAGRYSLAGGSSHVPWMYLSQLDFTHSAHHMAVTSTAQHLLARGFIARVPSRYCYYFLFLSSFSFFFPLSLFYFIFYFLFFIYLLLIFFFLFSLCTWTYCTTMRRHKHRTDMGKQLARPANRDQVRRTAG